MEACDFPIVCSVSYAAVQTCRIGSEMLQPLPTKKERTWTARYLALIRKRKTSTRFDGPSGYHESQFGFKTICRPQPLDASTGHADGLFGVVQTGCREMTATNSVRAMQPDAASSSRFCSYRTRVAIPLELSPKIAFESINHKAKPCVFRSGATTPTSSSIRA